MRIGISTPVIQRGRSGVGQYVLALVRALLPSAAEHAFTLFVLEQDLPLFEFAKSRMRIESIPERHRPALRSILWHQKDLPRHIRRLGIEVLHVPSYRRMLWRHPCALVSTIHDLAAFRLAGKYDLARMIYGRVAARALSRRQDEIIAVSRHTQSDLGTFFKLPEDRITVVHNGLDHSRFFPGSRDDAKAAVAAAHGLNAPFFLYVARLEHPAKNHVRLIEAFNRFKTLTGSRWQLVFAGTDWHGAEKIHEAVRASPYRDDVRCLGFITDQDLPHLYRAAEVFVYPSLFEGFGLPPLEAMACGCPVLASAEGALGEVVGEAAGRLDPYSRNQMASQLALAACDESRRMALRAAGLARAAEFNWDKAAAATLGVYAKALSGSKQPSKVRTTPSHRSGVHPLATNAQSG